MGDLGADRQTFLLDDKTCTVEQYFRDKYNRQLDYPHLNVLRVAPDSKKIYLPVEVMWFYVFSIITNMKDFRAQVKDLGPFRRCFWCRPNM